MVRYPLSPKLAVCKDLGGGRTLKCDVGVFQVLFRKEAIGNLGECHTNMIYVSFGSGNDFSP